MFCGIRYGLGRPGVHLCEEKGRVPLVYGRLERVNARIHSRRGERLPDNGLSFQLR